MSHRSQRYPQELRERAIRLVAEVRDQYESEWTAIESLATKLGIGSTETLRKWIRKAEIDAGQRPGGDQSRDSRGAQIARGEPGAAPRQRDPQGSPRPPR